MSTTAERLQLLETADFDTFGEQDKGPGEQPLATPEEVEAIKDAFYDRPWEDPTRYQDGFHILFGAMRAIAITGASREWTQQEATQALRRVMQRVLRGEVQAEVDRR